MADARSDNLANQLIRLLIERSMFLAAAESCTAGLIADALVRIPGASACFWGSFICYTPQAKMHMLGIREEFLSKYGMASAETAQAMALGALEKSAVHLAVSITGLAGPEIQGPNPPAQPPIGTIWIATAQRRGKSGLNTAEAIKYHLKGSRNNIRQQSARKALEQILILLKRI